MDLGAISGVITAILLVAFIGIVLWAWSSKRREQFDAMARMPLDSESTGEEKQS